MQKRKLKVISNEKEPSKGDEAHAHSHSDADMGDDAYLKVLYALSKENEELKSAFAKLFEQTGQALMRTLELRDPYTYGHSMRVMEYALLIGRGSALSQKELKELELAAMFHDLGKIGVRDCVLLKEGPLNGKEAAAIRMHPNMGHEILSLIDAYKSIADGVLHHHERLDGKGYPSRLASEKIPLSSRIILVADTFDAMTTTRPYRKLMPIETAYKELEKYSGSQFDLEFVNVFLKEHSKLMTGKSAEGRIISMPKRKSSKKAA